MQQPLKQTGRPVRFLLLSFVGVAAALLLVVGLAFEAQREHTDRMIEAQLRAVGELKVLQIRDWVAEWIRDGRHAGSDPLIADSFAGWMASGRQDEAAAAQWRRGIETLRHIYGYDEIDLYDGEGVYRAGSGPAGDREGAHGAPHRAEALAAMQLGRPVLVDLHLRDDHPDRVALGVMAPLLVFDGGEERRVGAIYLGMAAEQSLFPLLRKWPLPASRGETVLSRQEGDQIRFLFTDQAPPLSLLLPASTPDLPSGRLLRGEQGILGRAVDYAGTEVLAYSHRIPDTPWMLIAKQVLAEAEAPVRRLAWNYGSVAVLLFGALLLIYGTMWRIEKRRNQLLLLDQELKSRRMEQAAQQALVESEEKYRILADYSADWEYWVGPDGRFLYVSPACVRVCGHTPADFEADPGLVERMIHPDDLPGWREHLRHPPDPSHTEHELLALRIHTREGEERWIEHVCAPVFDGAGGYRGRRGSNRDITERKAAEAAVQRLNAELEERVRLRTAELETALKDLEGFSYSVSHDLRAPLRAIDGFAAVLAEEYAPQLDGEGLRLLGIVSDNATKMGRLIDDILAFSRAGRLELEQREVDMQALVEEVWSSLAAERGERRIEFRLGNLPTIQGDPHALRQVWQNLLANAIKFTRDRDQAVIEVTAEQGAEETCYTVKDNGVGFNPDYVGKLFVLFQRLHGMDEFEGTGVGLAIVHRFVQKHRGRVEADGRPDGGASFRFTMPNSGSRF